MRAFDRVTLTYRFCRCICFWQVGWQVGSKQYEALLCAESQFPGNDLQCSSILASKCASPSRLGRCHQLTGSSTCPASVTVTVAQAALYSWGPPDHCLSHTSEPSFVLKMLLRCFCNTYTLRVNWLSVTRAVYWELPSKLSFECLNRMPCCQQPATVFTAAAVGIASCERPVCQWHNHHARSTELLTDS
jgi:hypothetical protein